MNEQTFAWLRNLLGALENKRLSLFSATAFLFLGEFFDKPILHAPDGLQTIATRKPTVVLGILIEYVCIIAMPLIAICAYPILKRFSETAAIGVAAVLGTITEFPSALGVSLILPIAIQEMIMALWLIFKGFALLRAPSHKCFD